MRIGFDNDKYLAMQSAHIRERIAQFDNKLYLEFGGKLFDDYHASRVLPGFRPDSKLQMLLQLKDQAEVVIVISAEDIVANKMRGDYGITYDVDVLRLIDAFQGVGLFVGSVCVTKFTDAPEVTAFERKLNSLGIRTFRHYKIPGYPNDVNHIVSDDGYGKNDYIETERPLVVITAPGPGSGKMAVCLSQLYHEYKRGVKAGYAKFETFPIWNLPLKHPVNLAYEAATADLNDVNMIDPFHLEAYGKTTVNYNRDVEIFPVVNAMFELIAGKSPYRSPTDMGVNMAGNCIIDDEVCREASLNEIVRRYFKCLCDQKASGVVKQERFKLELLMNQAGIALGERAVEKRAHACSDATGGQPAAAIELADGTIVVGKNGPLLGAASSALLNALKKLAGIDQEIDLVSAHAIEPIQTLKTTYLGSKNEHDHFTMQIGNHCHCLFQISFQLIKARCLAINEIHRFREQNVEALRLDSALLQRLLACSVCCRVKAHGLCHRKLNVVIAQFFYKPGIFDAGTDTVSHLAGSFLNAVLPHSLSASIPCHQPA